MNVTVSLVFMVHSTAQTNPITRLLHQTRISHLNWFNSNFWTNWIFFRRMKLSCNKLIPLSDPPAKDLTLCDLYPHRNAVNPSICTTTNQCKGLEPACIYIIVSIVIICWREYPLSCRAVNGSNSQGNKKVMSTNSDLQSEQEAVNVTSTNKLKTERCCVNYCFVFVLFFWFFWLFVLF